MSKIKKSFLSAFVSLSTIFLFFFVAKADTNPNQTISGSVSASGNYSVDLGNSNVNVDSNKAWSVNTNGPWKSCNDFLLENNTLYVRWTDCLPSETLSKFYYLLDNCDNYFLYGVNGGDFNNTDHPYPNDCSEKWSEVNILMAGSFDPYEYGPLLSDIDNKHAYMAFTFNDQWDVINQRYGGSVLYNNFVTNQNWGGNGNICAGDDLNCKKASYATLNIQDPKVLSCSFNCDQKNNYNYSINYQVKKDNQYSTINTQNVYKCEEIKGSVALRSEWFGSLTHTCASRGSGRNLLYTIDTISPPTNFSSCSDQASCLSTGTEYSLTPTTFGKGVQKVSADFVSSAQNSLNAGTDSSVHCSGGICTPYASGAHAVSLNIPETSYFGSCRGTVQSETVEGNTITTPEVNINTAEAKIPGGTSTLNFNVLNRAPLAYLSLDKTKVNVGDEVTATCDIQDLDTCSDKIIKVKWTCYNDKKEQTNCYFSDNGTWKEGKLSKDVPDSEQSYQYRSIVKWKAGKQGAYAIACEGADNDETASSTGKTVIGITVGPATCDADGMCNKDCPYDPDCCSDKTYSDSHPQCNETCKADGICNPNCPYDPDCCQDKTYFDSHSKCLDTCSQDGICNLNCPYDPDCCGDAEYAKNHSDKCVLSTGNCTVTRTKPSLDITLINPFDQVDFQANVFGGFKPIGYTWYCDKNDSNVSSTNSTMRTDSHTCDKYSVPGKTYEPKAVYSYKDGNGNIQTQECANSQGVGVKVNGELGADSCTCNVLARPYGSTDPDDYVSNVKISARNKVDAKVTKNCTQKDPTVWTTDGTKIQTSDAKALIQYDQAGIGYIKANIGSTQCTGASVDISELMKWGQ